MGCDAGDWPFSPRVVGSRSPLALAATSILPSPDTCMSAHRLAPDVYPHRQGGGEGGGLRRTGRRFLYLV